MLQPGCGGLGVSLHCCLNDREMKRTDACKCVSPDVCRDDDGSLLPSLVSLVLLAVLLLADHCSGFAVPFRPVAYAIAFLPVGWPVLHRAVAEAVHGGWANEFLLMSIAAAGAFWLGEYPEAVAVMLFYSVGEYCQDKAVGSARRDIRSLVSLRPVGVTVADGSRRMQKKPEEVSVGEVIEVPAGGRVPIDAALLSAPSRIDLSALTGESMPRLAATGSVVPSGAIALERPLLLRVVHRYADSAMPRILRMVEEANGRKAPAELFMRRFARIYTPVVVLAALAIAFVPPLVMGFSDSFGSYLRRGLVFLVVSCPCALVVSIPLAYFGGIGLASRRGILFKGGNCLDVAARVTDVVFDKTGTLTCGHFEVERVEVYDGGSAVALLSLMAGMERHSTHPLARALTAYAESLHAAPQAVESLREVPGMGLTAVAGGHDVAVGNARLMQRCGIQMPEKACGAAGTVLYCCRRGVLAGCAILRDRPKEDARRAVEALRKQGMDSVSMLSGDRQAIVDSMAAELHLDHSYGDLLPQQKVDHIRAMAAVGGRCVAFVGDGINDAPALATGNVGFAMGDAGSDMAVEAADVVLRSGNPLHVAYAVAIGRATRQTVMANILMALGVKLTVMCLGVAGMANLWMAVFADSGVALLCVLNVMALLRLNIRCRLHRLA